MIESIVYEGHEIREFCGPRWVLADICHAVKSSTEVALRSVMADTVFKSQGRGHSKWLINKEGLKQLAASHCPPSRVAWAVLQVLKKGRGVRYKRCNPNIEALPW